MKTKSIAIKDLRASMASIANEIENNNTCFDVYRRSKLSFKIVPVNTSIEDEWETVIDFTENKESGLDINTALELLQ